MDDPPSYPEIVTSDRRQLIDDDSEVPRSRASAAASAVGRAACAHRRCLLVSLVFAVIALGHAIAIYMIYFKCHGFNGCVSVKVMALNTWGMPATFGSEYKTERMAAIAAELARGQHDLYLFEELWMQPDHEVVAAGLPEGFVMTGFRQLSLAACDGRASPVSCSGLAIASRFPLAEVEFNSYTWHGDPAKAFIDGEWLARKGVGRVRLHLSDVGKAGNNVSVDVFVTHTAADPDPSHGYDNAYYRQRQVHELMNTYVARSDADIVLLAGDMNAEPIMKPGEPYHMLRSMMTNCVEEIFYELTSWLHNGNLATYGNQRNTFSGQGKYAPVIYDYIFHKTSNAAAARGVSVATDWFDVPFLKFILNLGNANATSSDATQGKVLSYSDHEAVTSTIHVWA